MISNSLILKVNLYTQISIIIFILEFLVFLIYFKKIYSKLTNLPHLYPLRHKTYKKSKFKNLNLEIQK